MAERTEPRLFGQLQRTVALIELAVPETETAEWSTQGR